MPEAVIPQSQTAAAPATEQAKPAAPAAEPAKQEAPKFDEAAAKSALEVAEKARLEAEKRLATVVGAMTKKEKDLVERGQRLGVQKKEMEAAAQRVKQFEEMRGNARKNPVEVLAALGLDYDYLTNWVTSNGKLSPELQTKNEIEEAKQAARKAAEDLEAYKKEQEDKGKKAAADSKARAEQEFQRKYNNWVQGTVAFVQANEVQYPLTVIFEMEAEVPKLIELAHKKAGTVLSKEDAAAKIEEYIVQRMHKAVASEKWKKLNVAPAPKQDPAPKAAELPTEAPPRRTVSNDVSASSKTPAPRAKRETEQERMERAKKAFEEARTKRPS